MKRVLLFLLTLMVLSCNKIEQSAIPYANVYFKVDLRFTDKELKGMLAHKIYTSPRSYGEVMGYSGILVIHGLEDVYYAYELCCPHEAQRDIRIEVDSTGLYGICPQCSSKYEIASGGYPVEGPSKYYLRRCNIYPHGDELIIEGYSN